jgi:hypothetical protein
MVTAFLSIVWCTAQAFGPAELLALVRLAHVEASDVPHAS